jgi:Flp pilus assembly protein TadD
MIKLTALAAAALLASTAAAAQDAEIGYPKGSLGYGAIMSGDYAAAEQQIRESNLSKYDPARALNLGFVYAKTGRPDKAAKQFRRVLLQDDLELVMADGSTTSSHEAAKRALALLQTSQLGQR